MIDKLINLIREYAGDSIINNPSIPNDKNEVAVETLEIAHEGLTIENN